MFVEERFSNISAYKYHANTIFSHLSPTSSFFNVFHTPALTSFVSVRFLWGVEGLVPSAGQDEHQEE